MKYLLFLFALIYFVPVKGQPYLNGTSRWKQYYRHTAFPPGLAFVEDVLIQLDGDTIISSTEYHRVLKTGLATTYYIQSGDTTYHGPIHEYLDPIRETDQLIYAYDRAADQEYILYDFGAAIGDTLKSGHCVRDTVISIDTIYLGDKPRKRFHLPHANAEISTLVEGVGSTFGFYWQTCNVIPDPQIKLQCFSQDGAYIQFDPNYDCSGLIAANEVIQKDRFSIHPNPFTDEFEIHFSDDLQQDISISIVNMLGAVVFEKQLRAPGPVERIATGDIPAGLYIICVHDKQGITSYKMIKR
ncbi:MAG: T9SS type A sorting domain-containing protein [Saprospiraceae bacterium]